MKALVYKNLSDAFDVVDVAAGKAICNIIKADWEHNIAIVNGKTVSADYIVKEGDIIVIRTVPADPVTAIAIFVAIIAIGAGVFAGIEAYQAREEAERAQEEIEKMKNRSKDGVVNLPYIRGASNTLASGKTEPYIIGEHLFTPYILNSGGKYQGYSVIGGENGKDQYYVVVLEGGFNKQVLRRLKSNDVILKTWTGDVPQEGVYQFDAGPFYDAESLVEIAQDGKPFDTSEFNKKIVQQTLNDNLRKSDDEQYKSLIYTLEKHTMAADVCILFNGLLAYDDKSVKINRSVTVIPSYSLDGGNTWTEFYFNQNGVASNTFTYRTLTQIRFNAHIDFSFIGVKDLTRPIMIKLDCTTPKYKGSAYDQCYVQWVQSTIYNPDESKTGFVPEKIIGKTEAKLSTTIGLKIKSTTSNQDKLKKINVITSGVARTWDGVKWSDEKTPTRNSAAWLLEVLTSPTHTPSQCDDSEIDLESFGDLYEFCEREKLTCDMVLADGEPKENVLQKICQTCYATLYQDIYGKISVVSDNKKENAIAVFNEQNLISFSYEKDLARRTDGIKIKYISRAADYAEDTCLVMRKGAVRNSESILRDMNVTGITEYKQIAKYARYVMACDELRPKTATARVGKEGIFFTPLAKVLVQHPSLKIGLGSAQIKGIVIDGTNITGLRLYEPITLDTKHNFNAVIQCVSSNYCTPLALSIKRHNGRTKEITLTQPLPLASAVVPHAGDILSYGYKKETVTSPMLITGIQPDNDGYTLTLVDYNEAIYDAGDIPDYTPNITQSGENSAGMIPAPSVTPDDLDGRLDGLKGEKGEPGKPIVTPDATKSLLYFSCTDIAGEYLINNAKKNSFARLTGGKQVQGISGQALEFGEGQGLNFAALSGMTSCSVSVFFKLKTHGVIMQQCNKALKIKTAQDKLIIYPDPSKELTINTAIALDMWYCVIYSYDDSARTEAVRLYEYSENTGRYVISDRKKWDFDNAARDFTTAWNETIERDTKEATGTVDEIRIDGYCWNDEECEGWAYLKGGTGRMYTSGDYRLSHIEKIVQDAAPRYLGKFPYDPNEAARNGDWYAYSGETTAERIKGRCYRRVSSSLWVVVDSWQENIAAMPDLLSIADEAINNSLPAGQFTSVLAACDVFAKRLVANEAFINRLATNEAFIDKLITKKLLVDSDTANPDNFELAINEQVGILAKKSSEKIFEITPDGRGFFCGSIEAGPLSLSLKSPGKREFSFNVGTRVYLICKSVATSIHGAGLFYCSGSYGDKKLKAISFSYETRKQYADRIGGKYFVGGGFWGKIYQRIWRAEYTWQTGTIEFIYNDDVKETIKEAMTEILFFHVKDEFVRNDTRLTSYEESFADPSNSTSGVVEITKPLNIVVNADSHTLLLKKLPLGIDPSYISGTVYRDNDGRLYVVP